MTGSERRSGTRGTVIRGTVVLDAERCKGCGLCVPACRPGVLEMSTVMNGSGFTVPELRPGCTGCMACAEICPDFALEVWKFDEPIAVPSRPAPEAGAEADTQTDAGGR